MSRKNLVLKLNTKILSVNAAFLNFKNYWSYKVDFLHTGTNMLRLQIDGLILAGRGHTSPGMPKEAIKT